MRLIKNLGRVSPRRFVPEYISRPPYITTEGPYQVSNGDGLLPSPFIHSAQDTIEKMSETCRVARHVLDYCGSLVKVGITTDELDKKAHEMIIQNGAYPSTLGYRGYPKSICTSVNNVVCHGIPDNLPLYDGDIINIDVTLYKNGFHGDCSATYMVGKGHPSPVIELVQVAQEARDEAIRLCGPGVPLREVGRKIAEICRRHKFSSPIELSGHGIAKDFHTRPYIIHWDNNQSERMQAGLTFTIEPVICHGSPEFFMGEDEWTIFSKDLSWNAQFEHTILITQNGHQILTEL